MPASRARAALALALAAVLAFALPAAARADTPGLQQVDGGPGYWGRFTNPLPSDPGFFPLSVWFESVTTQSDVQKDKGAGLNTYVQLTANSDLSIVRNAGMHAIHDGGPAGEGTETSGWLISDEADMWGGPGDSAWTGNWGGEGQVCQPANSQCGYTVMRTLNARYPQDGRMRHTHYGKGIAFWETDAEAAKFLNDFQDSVATDIYWFTDNDACVSSQGGGSPGVNKANNCRNASNYAWLIQRERSLISPRSSKPVWGIVEVGHPFSEASSPSITPPQTRAAVWQSLIGGARGIIYFNHSFGGPCETQHALREPCYAQMRATVTDVNRQITELAPVLNAPYVTSGWSQGQGTTAMAKWAGGHFYVFAGSAGAATTGQFSIPCVGNATATALYENRSVPVTNGSFSDDFADGNAIHIYRIDGGSSCGLPADGLGTPPATTTTTTTRAARASRVWAVRSTVSLRSGRLGVPVTCRAACTVRSRLSRRTLLAARMKKFGPGRHTLILKLSRKARRRVAAARRPFKVRLTTVVFEATGKVARTQVITIRR